MSWWQLPPGIRQMALDYIPVTRYECGDPLAPEGWYLYGGGGRSLQFCLNGSCNRLKQSAPHHVLFSTLQDYPCGVCGYDGSRGNVNIK